MCRRMSSRSRAIAQCAVAADKDPRRTLCHFTLRPFRLGFSFAGQWSVAQLAVQADWRNRIAARSIVGMPFHRPSRRDRYPVAARCCRAGRACSYQAITVGCEKNL
jgi:hypothetical protein